MPIMLPDTPLRTPKSLTALYPWTRSPLIACGPMRLIATAPLAHAVSRAGGLGFIGVGTDMSRLSAHLSAAHALCQSDPILNCPSNVLPVGIGIITHEASLPAFTSALRKHTQQDRRPPPAAIWLFAPSDPKASDLVPWLHAIQELFSPSSTQNHHTPSPSPSYPQIWYQAGSVAEALPPFLLHPTNLPSISTLVLQTPDAGGHALYSGAGLPSFIPETLAALTHHVSAGTIPPQRTPHILAAGGIASAHGAAAALAAGAHGVVMGTAYLAAPEAEVHPAYRRAVLDARDGGQSTVRSGVYDELRGTRHWPERFGGRGVKNATWDDWEKGRRDLRELRRLYGEAERAGDDAGWGREGGRLTTYAGTGVGLVSEEKGAGDVTREVREGCRRVLEELRGKL